MTKRLFTVLAVLALLFTVATTVAVADGTTEDPDGVWETSDGAEWVRFFERRGHKQAQWHVDSFGPCRGGPASSSSANWWWDQGSIHVRVWATCDTARIRLRPLDLWFDPQGPDWDLFETNSQTEWRNYLYHPEEPEGPEGPPPGCYKDGFGSPAPGPNPDLVYSGVPDVVGNLQRASSADGSCSGGLGPFGFHLVLAGDVNQAITKCASLGFSSVVTLGESLPNVGWIGYPSFGPDTWACR